MALGLTKRDLDRLETCDVRLRRIVYNVAQKFDLQVICGHRGQAAQDAAYRDGFSDLKYPESKHNSDPSLAVDIAPSPINWKDVKRFHVLAGWMYSEALKQGVVLRWGGNWNDDWQGSDLGHYEINEPDN